MDVPDLGGIGRTICQIADSSSPTPQTLPFLRMARKTRPLVILAAASHSSIPCLIGASSGMERTFWRLPTKSIRAQPSLSRPMVLTSRLQSSALRSPQANSTPSRA